MRKQTQNPPRSQGIEQRQHINLSYSADEVIHRDQHMFMSKPSVSGFINTIFKNYKDDSEATISKALIKKENQLIQSILHGEYYQKNDDDQSLKYFEDYESKINLKKNSKEYQLLQYLLKDYERQLLIKMNSFPNGITYKTRLQNDVHEELYGTPTEEDFVFSEADYYKSQGAYLKAVIEDYATKSPAEREIIYFKDIVTDVNTVLATEKERPLLTIKYKDVNGKVSSYDVKIYQIISDPSSMQSGIIGFAKPANGPKSSYSINIFRFPRITNWRINAPSHGSGKLTYNEIDEIEARIKESGTQYLLTKAENISVFLTEQGINKYNRYSHLRPSVRTQNIEKTKDGAIYTFFCTKFQIESYFFRFGKDAIILTPEKLKQKMLKDYQAAIDVYSK